MNSQLRQSLERVARRFRHARLWSGLALCWLAWAIVGWVVPVVLFHLGKTPIPGSWLLGSFAVAAATGVALAIWAMRSVRDPRWVARRIEATYPELGTGLLAAVEQTTASPSDKLGYLQTVVIRQALEHRLGHDWDQAVPTRVLRGAKLAHAAALLVFLSVSALLVIGPYIKGRGQTAGGLEADAAAVQVEPGDAELERGTSLLVVARFQGSVPSDSSLVVLEGSGVAGRRPMTRSLEDPAFAGRVESVDSDLSYQVEFGGRRSRTFQVRVFEYPELDRADAKLVFPSFTSLAPKTVEDIRHITAVEGTEVSLICRLNKDVASAKLVDEQGQELVLTRQKEGDHVYQATMTLTDPRRYKVQLVDGEGRSNKLPAEIVANVTRNRLPVVTMSQPAHDVRVSPIEELTLKAQMDDDFGLVRQGITYTQAGGEPREIELPRSSAAGRRYSALHLLDFESLRAAPDQLVTYFFWAEDLGPDNRPRRASGDMFFAEVRPFEEIFRQGEQPSGGRSANEDQEGEGGNAQESERLADLQKEIINGTWKLIRRETGLKPSEKFLEDSKLLLESQHSAIEQAAQLSGRLRDRASKGHLDKASQLMKDAEKHLADAVGKSSVAPHTPALAAEQAAYQALLKLRAREFQVVRGNMRQRGRNSRGSSSSPSQRQLQQLELRNDENRYEEQRSARSQQSQQEQAQRETRQVLNRLRELAKRQTDLNDRLKELQSALEAAKTEQARQEIERQLKRLREQEQQILRDSDELRERMEREENRDRMADERQQMEQGREHVRQASEALEAGRLSQALTEGARAGRQLNDLREQLRKKAANRFADEMTEMRSQARRLDEDQARLSEQIDALKRESQRSLRGGEREQAGQKLRQQAQQLDQLLDQMRTTVQEAEETEPLLAKNLYDTARKATDQKITDALKVAEQLVKLGVADDASKAARHAGSGIQQLREGVEHAARSVLGDETAALKLAKAELDDLAQEVNREIAQATGQNVGRSRREGEAPPEPGQSRAGRSGREGEAPAEPGQARAGRSAREGETPPEPQQRRSGQMRGDGQPPPLGQERQGGAQPRDGRDGRQAASPGDGDRREGSRQAASPGGGGGQRAAGLERMLEGINRGPGGPITGAGFRRWSDRMRDVEELIEDPELRSGVARVRDRVRGEREEIKRHAREPDWNKLKELVVEPLAELRDRIAEEVKRRESPDALVPIDRDPVPPQFAEGVRRYYERLGSGR
ncbi:MAG: hypothetical protein ACLQVF_45520 [Isosphaeraceae bacterium]